MRCEKDTFAADGRSLYTFSARMLVVCPWCSEQAVILNGNTPAALLTCFHCGKNEKAQQNFVLDLQRNCPHCGKTITAYREVATGQDKAAIRIRCPHCREQAVHQVSYKSSNVCYSQRHDGREPFFGTQLWLQTKVRNHVLWAYNYEHLGYLQRFIEAKFRERNINGYSTMAAKLPDFIKSAKNREPLLHAIQQLYKK